MSKIERGDAARGGETRPLHVPKEKKSSLVREHSTRVQIELTSWNRIASPCSSTRRGCLTANDL